MKKLIIAALLALCIMPASAKDNLTHMVFEGIEICGDYTAFVDSLKHKLGWKAITDDYLEGTYRGKPCTAVVEYSSKTHQAASVYIKIDLSGKTGDKLILDLIDEYGIFNRDILADSGDFFWVMHNGYVSLGNNYVLYVDSYGKQIEDEEKDD